jgi:hypothetical protein
MPEILSAYLLLLWVAVSILSTGIALCSRFTPLKGLELVGYGAGAGVVVHGVFGLLIALSWHSRHYVGVLAILCAVLAVADLVRRRVWREVATTLSWPMRVALTLWLVFPALCVALVQVNVKWPEPMLDGQFIFKTHTLNTKIQHLTTLPVDNYIPYVVEEFFLRHISFKNNHPILPVNEVSNRTILMPLVALPFRALLAWNQPAEDALGKFKYAGGEWPDVGKLNDDESYTQFFIIGMFLNSLMLLGLLVLFSNFDLPESLPGAALLFISQPYFISQAIFTWPKAMAAFFVYLTWNSARRRHDPRIVGICAALAYHCHPQSLPIAAGLGLWYALSGWRDKTSFKPILHYAFAFGLMVLPWFVWTRLLLQLPDNMFAQNFFGPGAANLLTSPVNFIWMRFFNLTVALVPVFFMIYPFNLQVTIDYALCCVPSVVGMFVIVPVIIEWARRWNSERMLLLYGMLLPALAVILLFGVQFQPLQLGWQPMMGVLLFLGLHYMRRTFSPFTYRVLIALQLICNLTVIVLRGYLVGAHLT